MQVDHSSMSRISINSASRSIKSKFSPSTQPQESPKQLSDSKEVWEYDQDIENQKGLISNI